MSVSLCVYTRITLGSWGGLGALRGLRAGRMSWQAGGSYSRRRRLHNRQNLALPAAAKQDQSCPVNLTLGSKVPAFGNLLSVSLYSVHARKGRGSFRWVSDFIACRNRETSCVIPQGMSTPSGVKSERTWISELGCAPASPCRQLPG